jgi:glyoxylase-like metal-dependent hydrolase (beta-lactamase superfamily II)
MNELEMQLHYPLGDALPHGGGTLEVAPGVKWIRMSLPFALNHINLWLLRDCIDGVEGWSIVDCCIHRDEAKAQWESIFANELQGLPILRVIVTHMHPDHIGLAALVMRALERRCRRGGPPMPVMDQRHRLPGGAYGLHGAHRFWRRPGGGLFTQPMA